MLTHWLNTSRVNVIAAFQCLHGDYRLIYSTSPSDKHYGFYQLCPKCDGEKHIEGGSYNPDGSLTINRTCPLCEGEGKLVRPEIKPGE